MNLRWILPLGLAAFAGGCATPNLERIATVQSRAEALYAYGGVATFPVASELVEVSVFAPVHHQREYLPIPIEREKTKPVVNRQPAKPAATEPPPKPAVSEQLTTPAVSEPPSKASVGDQSSEPAVSESPTKPIVTHSADVDTREQATPTTAQEPAAQTKATHLESAETPEAQKVPVVTTEQPVAQIDKPQAADVRQQTLAADTRVSEKQPGFQKKVSKDRVNVGEKFAFTMEFQNSTPLDLASVQLTDPVDPRLKLFPGEISVKPNYEHHVSVGNGQVVVRFTKEIKRGKKVRVTVPVMFPVTSAAAAQ
jgi:uncharacterized repeat protein (TIGR01451 family)